MSVKAGGGGNAGSGSGSGSSAQDHTSIVMEYLLKRGYQRAAAALRQDIDGNGAGSSSGSSAHASPQTGAAARTVSQEAFEKRNMGLGRKAGVKEDPSPWRDGLMGLREFVFGSLDIHRPELLPILMPAYVHSYLDLQLLGYKDQANIIFESFAQDYADSQPNMVALLRMLKTPAAILENEQAQRWRRERYIVRMTRRGWSLLLGWLQGGPTGQALAGAVGANAAASVNNEVQERGREKMLGIINERVRVDLVEGKQLQSLLHTSRGANVIEGGLESELTVDVGGGASDGELAIKMGPGGLPSAPLKLGPMPTDPKLEREVQRLLQAEDGTSKASTDVEMVDAEAATPTGRDGPIPPVQPSDLPPYPPSFRTIDVQREVEKVREARKRIKLGPVDKPQNALANTSLLEGPSQANYSLPSVCMFTLHDTGDTLISAEFSDDSSILAGGFSESFIRLWNLKGEPLNGVRSDFDPSTVHTSKDLERLKQTDGPTTRKLIGHSGPVYSLSFDPIPGPSGPPRYLLSSSQDASVRLWSLDTYTNIVAYRGHRDPVWDVQWGPRGVYFATGSRDRTARLWTTERTAAVRVFAGHLSDVDVVRFHPNSLYLATGSSDRTCRLWDVQRGACVRSFVGHSGPVSTIALSPDGRYLASAGDDCSVNLWDLGTSRLVKSMSGHTARIHSLSFSAESTILVSGSADCTVRAWDVKSSRKSATAVNGMSNGTVAKEKKKTAGHEEGSSDLLVTLPTKRTPVFTTKFTPRNLCLAAGPIF